MADTHGVILAGGISSRMGFPKALMPISGTSFFLLQIYQRMIEADATPVHIVINSGLRTSLDAQMHKFPDARLVLNQEAAKGQIHSLQLALQAASADGAGAVLVTLVDLPLVKAATSGTVIEQGQLNLGKIIVPRHDGQHGHPFLIPREKFTAFTDAAEGKTARDIMHDHPDWMHYVDVADRGVLADIDTLEDLAKYSTAEADELD